MSAKKNKRKVIKHGRHLKNKSSLLRHHPRLFIGVGLLLVVVSFLLLTIGYVDDARVGLAMMSLFFGVALVIFANAALPKKSNNS